jgi:hypothetical protein
MKTFNYHSVYDRVTIRSEAREVLSMPRTFAAWGKQQLPNKPEMATWPARQWVGAFLQYMTGIPWLVAATSLDLAVMPRHDPSLKRQWHEETTDDPPLPLFAWTIALTQDDVAGAEVLRFIAGTLAPISGEIHAEKPLFLARAR